MKDFKCLCPLIIYTSPLSAAKKYPRGKFFFSGSFSRCQRCRRCLFIVCRLRTLASTPFFCVKNVLLKCKMSQMYISHSRVAVNLEKILLCCSAENKTAKLVEDIASEYSVELQALKNLEYFELKNLSDESL